jgi:hypothetical protein
MRLQTKNKKKSLIIAAMAFIAAGFALFAILINGFGPTGRTQCTMEARAGLVISLLDESGLPIDDALITADEGTQIFDEFDGKYMGLYENTGPHTFKIEKSGYQTYTESIDLQKDVCHIITKKFEIQLKK